MPDDGPIAKADQDIVDSVCRQRRGGRGRQEFAIDRALWGEVALGFAAQPVAQASGIVQHVRRDTNAADGP